MDMLYKMQHFVLLLMFCLLGGVELMGVPIITGSDAYVQTESAVYGTCTKDRILLRTKTLTCTTQVRNTKQSHCTLYTTGASKEMWERGWAG